eukprot:scaffold464682_cov34-Prasinocladus_malaysianus.AAC.2
MQAHSTASQLTYVWCVTYQETWRKTKKADALSPLRNGNRGKEQDAPKNKWTCTGQLPPQERLSLEAKRPAPEQVATRQASNAASTAAARSRETCETSVSRRAANATNMANVRSRETPEQAEARRAVDAANKANVRSRETPEQAEARRAADAAHKAD